MAYTFQATGDETEIYDEEDGTAVPVVLVPFLESETIDAHRARVAIVVDALNAAPQDRRHVADELAEALRRHALRALAANRIEAETNTADLEDGGDTFDEVHQIANDLTIATQRAFARRLGWLAEDDRPADDVPAVGMEMFDRLISGNASDDDIASAYHAGTGRDLHVAAAVA